MHPHFHFLPVWLPELDAKKLVGAFLPCPSGAHRQVLLLEAGEQVAPYVYVEAEGPRFLNVLGINAVRAAV